MLLCRMVGNARFPCSAIALCCTPQCIGGKRMIRGPSRRDKRAAGRISSSEGAME